MRARLRSSARRFSLPSFSSRPPLRAGERSRYSGRSGRRRARPGAARAVERCRRAAGLPDRNLSRPCADALFRQDRVKIRLARPSRFIDLNGRDLALQSVTATVAGQTIPGTRHELDPTGVARIVFPQDLPAGPVTLAFAYDGPFNQNPSGLPHTKIGDKWHSWSQFKSIDARAAFSSFDQPGFKIPFTVTLRTRPGQTAVSNAPEVSSRPPKRIRQRQINLP